MSYLRKGTSADGRSDLIVAIINFAGTPHEGYRVGPEAERRLAALLRACASELSAGNRVEAHERHYDEYFEVVRGRPVGRDAAIAAATARAGYFALFSNEVMGPFEALAAYRDKDAIEKRFGDVKSLLDLRTPRVSTEGTLAGKPGWCFCSPPA